MEPGLEAVSYYDPPNMTYPFGAYICVIDIDVDTGVDKVRRFYALDDCGTRINPMIIEGQVHGGLTEAFAIAMGQEIRYDENGNVHRPARSWTIFMPTAVETPHWETDFTVTPSPHHPIGAKGVGESPNVGGVPAFSNAVNDAFAFLGSHPHPDAARPLAQLEGGEGSGSGGVDAWPGMRGASIRRERSATGAAPQDDGLLARDLRIRPHGEETRMRVGTQRTGVAMNDRDEIAQALAAVGYIADRELATAISLMQLLKRPLLLEGEAGVGKTEVAKALAAVHATELIRLQCYEGLDQIAALYEWNYQRQLLAIQAHRGRAMPTRIEDQIFSEKYLLERPLLAAIRRDKPPVLLIDEIDRADEEFEAFLLELLSDFQVSIPELGTITATSIPHVVLTSNGTRELSDALRRRCLYHYVDYPDVDREARIIMARHRRRRARRCRCRSRAWSKASARRTCARCRASPRRSTGRRPWSASTSTTCTTRRRRCTRP